MEEDEERDRSEAIDYVLSLGRAMAIVGWTYEEIATALASIGGDLIWSRVLELIANVEEIEGGGQSTRGDGDERDGDGDGYGERSGVSGMNVEELIW
jgi:hypothetical protein